jgi:polysaccharide chain length determinant protein (PEP-CTERM system associated)
MHELFTQISNYLRGMWRNRWHLMTAMWFVCIVGWVVVYKLPDQYEATARVYVDTQSVLRPLLKGLAVEAGVQQEVALMTRTLLSRPNLEKVARTTDLDLKAKTPEQMDSLLDGLRHDIQIADAGKVDLYTISYQNSNPDLAKRVVQALLTIFVESSLGENRKDSDIAQSFLSDQVKDYEARLQAAEERLKEFKRKHIGMMPSQGKDYFQRLQDASEQLRQTGLTLEEAKKRRDELKRQLKGNEPTFGIATSPSQLTSSLDQRIQDLEEKLDNMLLQYTPQHPDVIAIKRTIGDLKKQREKEIEAMGNNPDLNSMSNNPVYQQMKIQLGTAEADVAALQARFDEQTKRVKDLHRMVDTIPQVEEDLAQLNRDYDVNKKNYEELLARLESARLSQQADQRADNIRFKIIDPPRVPLVPSAPNRPLFMSVVLVGGIFAGIALAIFMAQIRVTYDTRRSLAEATGLPVLGCVSVVWTPAMSLRRRLNKGFFIFGAVALFGLYTAIMAYFLVDTSMISHVTSLIRAKT